MKLLKNLIIVFAVLIALVGSAFATPISVTDVNVQEVNGDYMVLVSLTNANSASGVWTELEFTIEELGTTKNIGAVKIDSNDTQVLSYNLRDLTDSYNLLKKGSSYQMTVSTDTDSKTDSFLFGSEKDTDGLNLVLDSVKINNEEIDGDVLQVMNGQSLNVNLRFTAQSAFDDARIMVFLEGYEHSPLVDSTEIFSVVEGKTYLKTLTLNLPNDMNSQQDYKLRITGANDLSGITYKDYTVYLDTQRNRVDILDLVTTPSSGVEAGQNIIANVRMKNRGQKDQSSVKVIVEIPELGVKESSYISNLNSNEVATSDDMLLFVPEDAAAGEYEVKVTLKFNSGYDSVEKTYSMNVFAPKSVEEKNLLVSFKNNIDIKSGVETVIKVVIANPNDNSKPISIVPLENTWTDVEVSPSLAMVKAGDSQEFTIKVKPKSEIKGEKDLNLIIKEGSKEVNELTVSTYVEANDSQNYSSVSWLNIALAVLLIIAIIILLTLVISIAKRNGKDDDEDISSTEEYY